MICNKKVLLTFFRLIIEAIGSPHMLCRAVRLKSINVCDRNEGFCCKGAVSFRGTHISELKLVRVKKSMCRRDEPGSLRLLGEKTMFAVCYYGQCPPPSRWQNVNAMEHFQSVALSTEACQRSTSGVRLTALHYNAPSLDSMSPSPSSPFIYLPAVCHLLISLVGRNVISSPHSQTQSFSNPPPTQALAPSVGLSAVLVCP